MTIDRRGFFAAGSGLIAGGPFASACGDEAPPARLMNAETHTASVRSAPFLARGDGKTNDTRAIQSAINAVAAAGGGVVEIPSGDYLVDTIQIPVIRGGTLRIVGQGWSYDAGATSRVISASARPMFASDEWGGD